MKFSLFSICPIKVEPLPDARLSKPLPCRLGRRQVCVALWRWVDTSNGTFYTLTDTKRGKLSFYNVRGSVLKRSIRVKTENIVFIPCLPQIISHTPNKPSGKPAKLPARHCRSPVPIPSPAASLLKARCGARGVGQACYIAVFSLDFIFGCTNINSKISTIYKVVIPYRHILHQRMDKFP